MLVHALLAGGHDPAYLIGGELRTTGTNAAWGRGEWVVVEADESDGSFLRLAPEIAVVTNVELDHHTTWASRADLDDAFRAFLAPPARRSSGSAPRCARWRARRADVRRPDADLRPDGARFALADGTEVRLAVPGAHNALNAAAALEALRGGGRRRGRGGRVAGDLPGRGPALRGPGRAPPRARPSSTTTRTTRPRSRRRSRRRARCGRGAWSRSSSRTSSRARACSRASSASRWPAPTSPRCVDVYPARERAEDFPGTSGLTLAEAAADAAGGRPVLWLPTFDDAERALRGLLADGDLLLVMGAGDVDALGRRLAAPSAAPRAACAGRPGHAASTGPAGRSAARRRTRSAMPPSLALPRRALAAPRLRRPRLRVVLIALVVAALLGGGWLWLRQSSLVAVRHVTVTGASGPQAARIAAALEAAARDMTTLDVRAAELRRAVEPFPIVGRGQRRRLAAAPAAIVVHERLPVARPGRRGRAGRRRRRRHDPARHRPSTGSPPWPWRSPTARRRASTTARAAPSALLAAAPPRAARPRGPARARPAGLDRAAARRPAPRLRRRRRGPRRSGPRRSPCWATGARPGRPTSTCAFPSGPPPAAGGRSRRSDARTHPQTASGSTGATRVATSTSR